MQLNCLVSIMIPVYNGENYLRQAIDSALSQTYKNIEIIVVNDGSTDNTEDIALSYGDKIRYFYKENGGCASALNYGIRVMRGEYFSWLSHDDLYFPEKIEKQLSILEKEKLDEDTIISCEAEIIDKNGKKIYYRNAKDNLFYNSERFFSRLLFGKSLNGCGLLIPKKILDKVGPFNESLIAMPDWEYWLRISLSGFNLRRHGEDILVANRVHKSQVSQNSKKIFAKEYSLLIEDFTEKVLQTGNTNYVKYFYYYCIRKNNKKNSNILKKYLKDKKVNICLGTIKNKIYSVVLGIRSCLTYIYWELFRKA